MPKTKPEHRTSPPALSPPSVEPIGSVPEGHVSDFLTGNFVRDTPEEYVRQNLEKALVRQYRFAAADCQAEFPIKVGSARKRVDIVVFAKGRAHTQENATILVETKRAGTSPAGKVDGIEQLKSYMAASLNAAYGIWTNGDEQYCFAKRTQDGSFFFEEIIDVPGADQTEDDAQRPRRKDLRPATADNLLFAFRRCHNYIAGTEGKQKPEAFWELLKVIFCKIEDERSRSLDFFVTAAERSTSLAAARAKARLHKIFAEKVIARYPSFFPAQDSTIDLRPSVIAYVMSQLQGYSLLASPVDVKGVAYEEIVGSNLRGDRGEFFTPRNACRMAVTMLNPLPSERLVDPACGTGGFLITAMNNALDHIDFEERAEWEDASNGTDNERLELYRKRSEYLSRRVSGMDLNPGLVRAAKMNMVMNNDGSGGLFQANSLADPRSWDPSTAEAIKLGSFDVVITNPPFGANIVIDDPTVLAQYDLAAMWDRDTDGRWAMRLSSAGQPVLQKSQPPEILFIERCVQLLRPGTGRMAIVVPNGILNNPALGYVRRWLLTHTQILAVVDMARELFQPRNDTQTSMVLLRRLAPDEVEAARKSGLDYPIFMAIAERVGHDRRGNALFRRDDAGDDVMVTRSDTVAEIDPQTGNEVFKTVEVRERLVDDDLPEVALAYRRWLSEVQ